MDGKTPAPWFLEVNGGKQGPYTSQQIMKLVMDGALKVESRIYDSAAGSWKIAADVIPYLELDRPAQPLWQPPPKPAEFRNVHVVDLNAEPTGTADYFALINDRKRELQQASARNRAAAPPSAPKRAPEAKRTLLAADRRVAPASEPAVSAQQPQPHTTAPAPKREEVPLPMASGLMTAEVDRGAVLNIMRKVSHFYHAHRNMLSVAAAMLVVFVGIFGLVVTMSERRGREPANIARRADVQRPGAESPRTLGASVTRPNADAAGHADVTSVDRIGTGRNRVSRHSGSVSAARPDSRRQHLPPQTLPAPSVNEPPREPAQYYSSSQSDAPEAVPPPAYPDQAYDPNSGVVDPPAYDVPPALNPPDAENPDRYPAEIPPPQYPMPPEGEPVYIE